MAAGRHHRFMGRWLVRMVLGAALVLTACGDDEPELTIEDRLEAVEGRTLTAGEVADLLSTADALCRLDDRLLDRLWLQLDETQLEFQDFVFGQRCPDRAILYAGHTGRYVTDEATESGVTPSTTRPPTTTGAGTGSTGPGRRGDAKDGPTTTEGGGGGIGSLDSGTIDGGATVGGTPETPTSDPAADTTEPGAPTASTTGPIARSTVAATGSASTTSRTTGTTRTSGTGPGEDG